MVDIRIVEESATDLTCLAGYGAVPIALRVESRLVVTPVESGLGGLLLTEEPVAAPYVKDYDAIVGEGPARWPATFDLTHWGMWAAYEGTRRVGGAVVAWKTPGLEMLAGRQELAALWDLRVDPAYRGRGVGRRLFESAATWAQGRGCRELTVETQNINVPACRFYARQGCRLRSIRCDAYPGLPDEVQLLWCKRLTSEGAG